MQNWYPYAQVNNIAHLLIFAIDLFLFILHLGTLPKNGPD
jgi:hypothetical protein